MALGGSTNAVIHLIAMARRAGIPLDLERFDAARATTPVLANLRPSGKYLMEDFFYAGGLRGADAELADLLDADGADRQRPARWARTSPAPRSSTPTSSARSTSRSSAKGGLAVLRGKLAPDGAVIKPAAADAAAAQAHAAGRSSSPTTTTWRRASTTRDLDVTRGL